jgi:hypothetical protein
MAFEVSEGQPFGPGSPVVTSAGIVAAVHLDGDQAIVLYADGDTFEISVHVFVKAIGGWEHEADLTDFLPADGVCPPTFKSAVKLSGDLALVGASTGSCQPVVRAFMRTEGNWGFVENLTAANGEFGEFGHAIDLEGTTAVVCSRELRTNTGSHGSTYCYDWNGSTWELVTRITGPSGRFAMGNDVDLDGDQFVVGFVERNGFYTGSTFNRMRVYRRALGGG